MYWLNFSKDSIFGSMVKLQSMGKLKDQKKTTQTEPQVTAWISFVLSDIKAGEI